MQFTTLSLLRRFSLTMNGKREKRAGAASFGRFYHLLDLSSWLFDFVRVDDDIGVTSLAPAIQLRSREAAQSNSVSRQVWVLLEHFKKSFWKPTLSCMEQTQCDHYNCPVLQDLTFSTITNLHKGDAQWKQSTDRIQPWLSHIYCWKSEVKWKQESLL